MFDPLLRLGKIAYHNVEPIYYGLEAGPLPKGLEIIPKAPSVLGRMMAEGALDVSPVSSASYARHHDDWLLLPDLSVGSNGKVLSVLLVSRVPVADLDGCRVILSSDSVTSVELLRLTFDDAGISPVLETGRVGHPSDVPDHAAAALVIGDLALTGDWKQHFPHVIDLAEAWQQHCGLPFIFAVWAVRKSVYAARPEAVHAVSDLLRASKQVGLTRLPVISEKAAAAFSMPVDIFERWFAHLQYDLGDREQAGLHLFFRRIREAGHVTAPERVRFI